MSVSALNEAMFEKNFKQVKKSFSLSDGTFIKLKSIDDLINTVMSLVYTENFTATIFSPVTLCQLIDVVVRFWN